MNTQFFLGAYWHARRESIDECTDRMHQMLSELSTCDEILATWYELGHSQKRALEKQINISNRECLLKLLDGGRHKRDTDKTVIGELGFSAGLWNGGGKGKEVSLMVTCGSYSSNPHLGNCVTLNFPENLGKLKQSKRMVAVLASVATAWEPDWAGVMSRNAMNERNFNARVPFVDWMIYVNNRLISQVPSLPSPIVVQQIEKIGSIIIIQNEPPVSADPKHLQNIERIQVALKTMR